MTRRADTSEPDSECSPDTSPEITRTRRTGRERDSKPDPDATPEALADERQMATLGRLAADVAHDLNNLLAAIRYQADFALRQAPGAQGERYARAELEQIVEATRRGAELTGQVLSFARTQAIPPRQIDAHAVVNELAPMLQRLAGPRVRLGTRFEAPRACVRIEPGRFEQIIANLVVNARDAIDGEGRITLTTACEPHGQDAQVLVLGIEDTGTGMSPEVRERVFEPYFTTKVATHGTGLGLSIVTTLVLQACGTIRVAATSELGTRFEIRLPLQDLATS